MSKQITMTHKEWNEEAIKRFGPDPKKWKFICPSCGYIASVQEWKDAGASDGEIAFSCIGRRLRSEKTIFDKTGGPCNYTGGGLLGLNPVTVMFEDNTTMDAFAFAEA